MSSVRIKFCGMTRLQDVQVALQLGVDALGFVFTRRSARFIEPQAAARIRAQIPASVRVVALFMDDAPAWIEQVVAAAKPDLLQFHGDESPSECAAFALPYLKAVPMASLTDVASYAARFADAEGVLLDAHASGGAGGSGSAFDWSRVPKLDRPLWLAGGLHAGNVAEAIARTRPFALDVSSGIEASPGIKDESRMHAFVSAVRVAHESSDRETAP